MPPYVIYSVSYWDGKSKKAFVGEYSLEGAIEKFKSSVPDVEVTGIESTGTGLFIS